MSAAKSHSEFHNPKSEPIRVLLIEDNPGDARLIQEMMAERSGERLELECADRLSAGLERLAANDIEVVLLDLGLSDSQGFDTFARMHAQAPRLPIVVLSGLVDEDLAIKTVQAGAQDYLVKGQIDSNMLLRAIRYAIERKRTEETLRGQALIFENIHDGIIMTDLEGNIITWNPAAEMMFGYLKDDIVRKTLGLLSTRIVKGTLHDGRWFGEMIFTRKDGTEGVCETVVIPLREEDGAITAVFGVNRDITERKQAEDELKQSFEKLQRALEGTVSALASAVEMKDPYTAGHQRRVAVLADAIAHEMGISEHQIEGIRLAGLIHDLGKINVPAEILSKPGRISEIEFNIIKIHPQAAYDALKTIDFPWPVAQIVLQHHERMNGSGYPQGISGNEIIVEAKILAVADVVEAMASDRPYRPALGVEAAMEEIHQKRGVLYDNQVVDACLRLFKEKGFSFT